jgi:release factor glutamine methyltransferase
VIELLAPFVVTLEFFAFIVKCTMADTPKTVAGILDATANYLSGKGVDESRLAAEHLLGRLLNCKRLEIHSRSNEVLTDKQLEAMRRGMKRLAAGEPVQYVLGQWDFMGHTFKVDRRALIPRPETEVLVETVLKCGSLWSRQKPVIVDVGTGSGCIAISLALAKPDALYLALDTSNEALELARENAVALGLAEKVAFTNGEMCDLVEPTSLDAIVANLPYIPTAEYERLPVHIRNHEPRVALDGGPNGRAVIELVVQDAAMALKPGGFLFLEIGEDQAAAVSALLESTGFDAIETLKDLAGRDRVVKGVLRE